MYTPPPIKRGITHPRVPGPMSRTPIHEHAALYFRFRFHPCPALCMHDGHSAECISRVHQGHRGGASQRPRSAGYHNLIETLKKGAQRPPLTKVACLRIEHAGEIQCSGDAASNVQLTPARHAVWLLCATCNALPPSQSACRPPGSRSSSTARGGATTTTRSMASPCRAL